MTTDFTGFGLPQKLMQALQRMDFKTPTPVQAQAIPPALNGRDILGSAQTGTGKTGAFGIPLVAQLIQNPQGLALILTPTRELAAQVEKMLKALVSFTGLQTACLIGGEPMHKQLRALQNRPRIIVGTPGRVNDHIERRSLKLDGTRFLVLDEMDRMLDMGFGVQIDRILQHVPSDRQTLLFSATIPPEIVKIAQKYLRNPERISVGSTTQAAVNITQEMVRTSDTEKYTALLAQLEAYKGTVIIFVKTKYGTEKLAKKLIASGYSADAIHGDLKQSRRDRVIAAFRAKKFRILVATDVAARGLDVPHIETVINHDLPQVPEDYIHRIGRTARAGAAGRAINLVTPADNPKWNAIFRLMNPGEKPPFSGGTYSGKPQGKRPQGKGRPQGKPWGKKPDGERRFGKPGGKKPFHRGQGPKTGSAAPNKGRAAA